MLFIQLVVYVLSAFAGPERYPPQKVTASEKFTALLQFAQTGDARGCDKVLARIREKRKQSEDFLSTSLEAQKQLEEGVQFWAQRAWRGPREAQRYGEVQESLKNKVWRVNFLKKLIAGRHQEERVVLAFQYVIKTLRDARALKLRLDADRGETGEK